LLPLAGVKVVEVGQNLAGPVTSQILGDLGAQVIKVEKPGAATIPAPGDRRSSTARR